MRILILSCIPILFAIAGLTLLILRSPANIPSLIVAFVTWGAAHPFRASLLMLAMTMYLVLCLYLATAPTPLDSDMLDRVRPGIVGWHSDTDTDSAADAASDSDREPP